MFALRNYSNIGSLGFIAGSQHLQCSEKQNSSRPFLYNHDFEYGSQSNPVLPDKLREQVGFIKHTKKEKVFVFQG